MVYESSLNKLIEKLKEAKELSQDLILEEDKNPSIFPKHEGITLENEWAYKTDYNQIELLSEILFRIQAIINHIEEERKEDLIIK